VRCYMEKEASLKNDGLRYPPSTGGAPKVAKSRRVSKYGTLRYRGRGAQKIEHGHPQHGKDAP